MIKTYKLIAVACITAMSLLISKQATSQTTNSKIPFQGSLYDQGVEVNGSKSMVFSIASASWTETHSVQVVNGLYSVVLGSVTPLPANLFAGVDSQQLTITVEGTGIGAVAIYKPFQGDIAIGTSGTIVQETDGTDTWSAIQLGNTNGKSTTINSDFMQLNNLNGNKAAQLQVNSQGAGNLSLFNDFGVNTGWFGNQGNKGGLWQIIGDDGSGGSTGAILSGFWGGTPAYVMEDENARQGVTMSMETGGAADKSGLVFTWGPTTPNVEIRGKGWDNNELPTIQMFGEHGDGGGWYKSNAIMEVNSDGTTNWGNLLLQNSEEGGGRHETTVLLDGNDGSLTLRSADGSQEFRIDPSGIAGDMQSNGKIVASVVDGVENENITIKAESFGDGDGATGWGTGSYNIGLRADASNNVWGNVGVTGYAIGTVGFTNSGGTFFSKVDDGTTTVTNQGLYTEGSGPGVNYGIYANAFNGVENWAGWFNGDVMVDNALLKLNNANGNQAAQLYANAQGAGNLSLYNNFGVNTGWFGNQADKGGLWQIIGDDGAGNSTGAILSGFWSGLPAFVMEDANAQPGVVYEMQDDGTDIWSYLNLYKSPSGGDGSASANTVEIHAGDSRITLRSADGSAEVTIDPYNGVSGQNNNSIGDVNDNAIQMDSQTLNIHSGGDGSDNGWNVVNLSASNDGSQQWGSLNLNAGGDVPNIAMGGKSWEGPSAAGRPYLSMKSSFDPGGGFQDLIWMDVFDNTGDGSVEAGGINFMSTDGSSFGINAYGLTGQMSDLDIANSASIGDVNDNAVQMGSQSLNIHSGGDGSDNGWSVVNLNANNDGSQQWGSLNLNAGGDVPNIEMGGKSWEGSSAAGRPYMTMRSSFDPGGGFQDLIWMDVFDNTGDGSVEAGGINFMSTDGSSFGINAYGLTGQMSDLDIANSASIGDANDNGVHINQGYPMVAIWSGGTGADDGIETILLNGDNASATFSRGAGNITLDGQNGNIGVNGDVSSLSMTTTNLAGQFIDASTQVQAGDFFNGTGSLMSSSGNIEATGIVIAGGVTLTSDARLKTNIITLNNSLSNILKLRGVSYNWKDINKSQKKQIGVIAQEVEEVYPEFVHTDREGMKSVNYSQMTAVLIEAVKELNAKVEVLEGENSELKAELSKVDLLEQKIKKIEKLLTGSKNNSSSLSASK